MNTLKTIFTVVVALAFATSTLVRAQNCGCDPTLCCSKFGFCGEGDDFCGDGCQAGPCTTPVTTAPTTPSGISIPEVVTDVFFSGILDQADSSCAGKIFYSRSAFLDAVVNYPEFGAVGSADDSKREFAAFFAHVTHETGHFCHVEEINGASGDYCDETNTQWPCNPEKSYFGRGPIQLSWNFNYGSAGQSIGFDGLNAPETVGSDPVIAFRTAFWYWMNNVHAKIVSGEGFGSTIRAINGAIECDGGNTAAVNARIGYYQQYCTELGVFPGDNLSC